MVWILKLINVGGSSLYMSRGDILQRLNAKVYECRGCVPLHKCCVDMLRGVNATIYQHRGSTCLCKGDIDVLKRLEREMDQHRMSTPVYKCCMITLPGVDCACTHAGILLPYTSALSRYGFI